MKRLAVIIFFVLCASASAQTKYSLVNGCYSVGASGPLRFQAASLGEYVLYTSDGRYLGANGPAATPGQDSIWRAGDDLTLTNVVSGAILGKPAPAQGCAEFPEVELNATGTPTRGKKPYSGVHGVVDQHAHLMAFDFLGGDFHCGRPWSPLGVTVALPDCASIQGPRGSAAPVQNFLDYGEPVHPHDTVGWPTFVDWPKYHTLSYEQTYYRWLQRAWMGGLRLVQTNMVDNEVLCRLLPMKHTDCVDMSAVTRQVEYLRQLQDYVDAQSGGPGQGWLRIVTDPFEARKVVNEGKLAVVMGAEVSRMFGCGVKDEVPECTAADVDAGLDAIQRLGIRAFYPVHKFDNAFGGTKMDGGQIGAFVNAANREETGAFWSVKTCEGKKTDNDQEGPPPEYAALIAGPLAGLAPPGAFPVYPPPPHCNQRGLTDLGRHVLKGMMDRGFLIEIDHLSAKAADEALDVVQRRSYSGVMSSHSWTHELQLPAVRALGGSVAPSAGESRAFVKKWKYDKAHDSPRFPYFIGFGADTNGLAAQPPPRPNSGRNGVAYPFEGGDGAVTFHRQRSGEQTYDINVDGVAHYGMIPDWLEDLRRVGGKDLTEDLFNGAEGYLQMWERANGIPAPSCPSGKVTTAGYGPIRLGVDWKTVLREVGQPWVRPGDAFRWCHDTDPRRVGAVFRAGRAALAGYFGPRVPKAMLARAREVSHGLFKKPAGGGLVYLMRKYSLAIVRANMVRTKVRARRAMRHAGL